MAEIFSLCDFSVFLTLRTLPLYGPRTRTVSPRNEKGIFFHCQISFLTLLTPLYGSFEKRENARTRTSCPTDWDTPDILMQRNASGGEIEKDKTNGKDV